MGYSSVVHLYTIVLALAWTRVNSDSSKEAVRATLLSAQARLNETLPGCPNYGFAPAAVDYLRGKWDSYLGGVDALVYLSCINTIYFGNHIGTYLNEVACAHESGANFVAVRAISHEGAHPETPQDQKTIEQLRQDAFLEALPQLIVHPNPLPRAEVKAQVAGKCNCQKYCWADPNAAWVRSIPLIRQLMQTASDAYFHHDDRLTSEGTRLDEARDSIIHPKPNAEFATYTTPLIEHNTTSFLPLVPDTAIQYRCSDNLGFRYGAMGYGILPFRAITKRIKADDLYIYVLAEQAERTHPNPYCNVILMSLISYIHRRFPASTVVLKRGGDPLLDYVRFINAKTTVCSASTFCFFAGISTRGTTHFPLTNLIIQADPSITNEKNAPDFGPNFKWIFETEAIFHFKKATSELLELLEKDAP